MVHLINPPLTNFPRIVMLQNPTVTLDTVNLKLEKTESRLNKRGAVLDVCLFPTHHSSAVVKSWQQMA